MTICIFVVVFGGEFLAGETGNEGVRAQAGETPVRRTALAAGSEF